MRSSMASMAGSSLFVSETFISLQGEGVSAGAAAAFLRLARCNLACDFCDTAYSWDFDTYDFSREVTERSLDELCSWVSTQCPGRLIVTGGEPLVQQKQLVSFLSLLGAGGTRPLVEVETNGTIRPSSALEPWVDQWNVSPKLSGSGESEVRRLRRDVLEWFARREHAYFKFVVTGAEDVSEAMKLVSLFEVPRQRVLLMPEARTKEALAERFPQVAEWALAHRVRVSGRLHLELFNGRRGT